MILDAIRKRRAIRNFAQTPVSPDAIAEMIKAALFAPTGKNKRAVEFIVVTDAKTKEALRRAFTQIPQEFVKDAPAIIVPVVDTSIASKPVEDLALASENIFLQATELGIGSIWKHVHEEERESIKELLGIPEHFLLINVIPIGYAIAPLPPHSDQEFDGKKIHQERW